MMMVIIVVNLVILVNMVILVNLVFMQFLSQFITMNG